MQLPKIMDDCHAFSHFDNYNPKLTSKPMTLLEKERAGIYFGLLFRFSACNSRYGFINFFLIVILSYNFV